MTTSGTVAQTTIPVIDIIDHSIMRCGVEQAKINAEHLDIARKNLFYYIMYLANKGVNLWTIDRVLIGLLQGQNQYFLPAGTIDTLNLLYRILMFWSGQAASSAGGIAANAFDQNILTSCIQTAPNGNISVDFGPGGNTVTTVGVMPFGNLTLTPAFEYSTDNVNWFSVLTLPATMMTDGQWYYYDISAPQQAEFFRIRETGGATMAVREVVFGWSPTEIPVQRVNRDDYSNLPNKTFQSELPTEYWYNRLLTQPAVVVWPTPQNFMISLVAWRHRQIQDIGDLTNTIEVPQRWYDCILANLAHRNSLDITDVDPNRITMLERLAAKAEEPPFDEERDKAPSYWTPNIGYYTGRRNASGGIGVSG